MVWWETEPVTEGPGEVGMEGRNQYPTILSAVSKVIIQLQTISAQFPGTPDSIIFNNESGTPDLIIFNNKRFNNKNRANFVLPFYLSPVQFRSFRLYMIFHIIYIDINIFMIPFIPFSIRVRSFVVEMMIKMIFSIFITSVADFSLPS